MAKALNLNKNRQNQKEHETAKQEIIAGIKAYDTEQKEKESIEQLDDEGYIE